MLNKKLIIGFLGQDAETKTTNSGKQLVSFSVATQENYKDKNGEWQTITTWHNVMSWGDLWDGKLFKGDLVFVEGKDTVNKVEDKEYRQINAFTIKILKKASERVDEPKSNYSKKEAVKTSDDTISDDDLPF